MHRCLMPQFRVASPRPNSSGEGSDGCSGIFVSGGPSSWCVAAVSNSNVRRYAVTLRRRTTTFVVYHYHFMYRRLLYVPIASASRCHFMGPSPQVQRLAASRNSQVVARARPRQSRTMNLTDMTLRLLSIAHMRRRVFQQQCVPCAYHVCLRTRMLALMIM